jgi:nucleoside-diphosphate-sugar epimerase
VRVLARSVARAKATLPSDVDVVVGDITDPAAVARAVRGQRIVYHLATSFRQASIPARRHREIHVDGTRLLLEAAHAAEVQRVVHCSTVGVLSHIATPPADETWAHSPGDVYQATKSEAEQLALAYHRTHGLPVAVAWPTPIYGPGDLRLLKLFRLIARRRFVMLGTGDVFFHMVHVADLVRGLQLLAERPEAVGEVFILGGGEYRTLNEVAALVAAAVGAPPPRLRLPAWPFQLAGIACERICMPLHVEPPIYRRRVDFFTKSRAFRIDKAVRLLGYSPVVDLETGIRETAEWYRREGLLP